MKVVRQPTPEEFKKIVQYMTQSWVFISDDDMYQMVEEELFTETKEIQFIMASILGKPFEVDRYASRNL